MEFVNARVGAKKKKKIVESKRNGKRFNGRVVKMGDKYIIYYRYVSKCDQFIN